ncbi:MAG: hypothetical protein R3C12_11860 [Planctomycetaceae bacterium]
MREMRADAGLLDASGQSLLLDQQVEIEGRRSGSNKDRSGPTSREPPASKESDEGATIIMQLEGKKGWFWYIPLHNDIVSVGVVSDFDYLFKGRADHATTFQEEMDRCPAVVEAAQAEQVDRFYATRDFTLLCRDKRRATAGC